MRVNRNDENISSKLDQNCIFCTEKSQGQIPCKTESMASQSHGRKKAILAHIKVISPIYKPLNQIRAKIQTRVRFTNIWSCYTSSISTWKPKDVMRLSAVHGHLGMVLQKLRDVLIDGILLLRCVPSCCADPQRLQIAHTFFHNKCEKTHGWHG